MNVKELLRGEFLCSCGQKHSCDIKEILVEKGALDKIPGFLAGHKNALLVSDGNTKPLCGEKVLEKLRGAGMNVTEAFFNQTSLVIPDEHSIAFVDSFVTADTDVIVGVGSGVINDLCKYVSFTHKLPYMIVATAPSMDGYASKGAAMIISGMKVTYTTHVASWIVGDTDILANAQAVIAAHPVSVSSRLVTFANQRAVDLLVIGGLLLIAGLVLTLIPGKLAKRWKSPLFRKGTLFTATVALLAAALHYADGEMWDLMRQGVFDTLYMTIPSTFFAYVLGLPLGVLLVITAPGHIRPNATLNNVVGTIINFLRSIPFIILLVMLFDVTRIVMGTAIGTRAVIFPLFVSAFPYVARIVEGSLNEVDHGVIEAAESMGSTTWQIIRKVLIPEAMPSLINGAAICMTTILAYTAMAGSAGGDGLGKIAITYGLNYREYDIMYVSSLLLVALVQIIQIAGGILMRAADHRKK